MNRVFGAKGYQFYDRHRVGVGLFAAAVAWVVLVIYVHVAGTSGTVAGSLHGIRAVLYGTVAAIAASLLGFILAAVTIIIAALGSDRFQLVRQSRFHGAIYKACFWAIALLALTTMWGVIALVVDTDDSPKVQVALVLAALVAASGYLVYQVVWVLWQITKVNLRSAESGAGK